MIPQVPSGQALVGRTRRSTDGSRASTGRPPAAGAHTTVLTGGCDRTEPARAASAPGDRMADRAATCSRRPGDRPSPVGPHDRQARRTGPCGADRRRVRPPWRVAPAPIYPPDRPPGRTPSAGHHPAARRRPAASDGTAATGRPPTPRHPVHPSAPPARGPGIWGTVPHAGSRHICDLCPWPVQPHTRLQRPCPSAPPRRALPHTSPGCQVSRCPFRTAPAPCRWCPR